MNRSIKALTFLFLLFLLFSSGSGTLASDHPIKLYFNDEQIMDIENDVHLTHGRVMVPFRSIFEHMDTTVSYNAQSKQITAVNGDREIIMTVGEDTALLNGEQHHFDVPPMLVENRLKVPLRFVSEAMYANVSWVASERAVYIEYDWHQDEIVSNADESLKAEEPDTDFEVLREFIKDYFHESALDDVNHDKLFKSSYDFDWFLTEKGLNYSQIGLDDQGEAVAFFTTDVADFPIENRDEVHGKLGEPVNWLKKNDLYYQYSGYDTWDLYETEAYFVTFFYDAWNSDSVQAMFVVDRDEELSAVGYFGNSGAHLRESFETQTHLLTNTIRKNHDLESLEEQNELKQIAYIHSVDMVEQNFFSHINHLEESPFDRIRNAGYVYSLAGENLARNHLSPFHAVFSLMNSDGHRKNILHPDYENAGVGVAFDGKKPYITQLFTK